MPMYRVRRSESGGKYMRIGYIANASTLEEAQAALVASIEWRGRDSGGKLATPRAPHFGKQTVESYNYKRKSDLYGEINGELDIVVWAES